MYEPKIGDVILADCGRGYVKQFHITKRNTDPGHDPMREWTIVEIDTNEFSEVETKWFEARNARLRCVDTPDS